MEEKIKDLYLLPDIDRYEDIHLITLSEQCAALEMRVLELSQSLPESKRQVIEDYIRTRDDLEFETFKTALRWGKLHYK